MTNFVRSRRITFVQRIQVTRFSPRCWVHEVFMRLVEQSRVNWKVAAGLAIGPLESALEVVRSWSERSIL